MQIKEIEDQKNVVPLAQCIKRTKCAKVIVVSDFKSCLSFNAGYIKPMQQQANEEY